MTRRLLTLLAVAMMATVTALPAEAQPGSTAPVDYHEFAIPGGLWITHPTGTLDYAGKTYEYDQWTSPYHRQGFDATQLIASWNARTPEKTWIQVETQGRTKTGAETAWYVL